jgi:hypothetical protein
MAQETYQIADAVVFWLEGTDNGLAAGAQTEQFEIREPDLEGQSHK